MVDPVSGSSACCRLPEAAVEPVSSSSARSQQGGDGVAMMVVTQLELQLCYQGKKLRGFTCKLTRSVHGFRPESSYLIAAQVTLPYLVSGLGMVAAGMLMDIVQVRSVFCVSCSSLDCCVFSLLTHG